MEHNTTSLITPLAQQLRLSPTLQINELVRERLNAGLEVVHLGFGEATFPIEKRLLTAHREASNVTSYMPVAGLLIEVSFLKPGKTASRPATPYSQCLICGKPDFQASRYVASLVAMTYLAQLSRWDLDKIRGGLTYDAHLSSAGTDTNILPRRL